MPDARGTPPPHRPDNHTPRRRTFQHTPATTDAGPFTLRDFSVGFTAKPVTVGLAEIGPEPADCSLFSTAAAGGRTAGGRACAQPIRVKMVWW